MTMFAAIVALMLFFAAGFGVYLLLKNMGEEGVEVAAPGSCKSGKCGVQPGTGAAACSSQEPEQYVEIEEVRRERAISSDQAVH